MAHPKEEYAKHYGAVRFLDGIQNTLRYHDASVLAGKEKEDSVNGMTVNEVLLSLNTVFAIGDTGNWRLTAISKNVREIYRLFGLKESESGQVILS